MRPQRPYLLRAFYDWLLDSQLTPHIVVNANYYDVEVPLEFVRDGQIILNIAPQAVSHFEMTMEAVSFNARFGGVPRQVYVPMGALLAIYARENGAGTMFQPEEFYDEPEADQEPEVSAEEKPRVVMQLVDDSSSSDTSPSGDDEPPQPPKGRPSLRVVK
jgi:stringent starvation protein B